ncbi:hypothetical protein P9112_003509 [Eukaryota sp. TZLM1-RC]
MTSPSPSLAIVHPLVLLSVSDHHKRVSRGPKQRVCGLLLGTVNRGVVDITNCFAVPFEENPRDPKVWMFDHQFAETMFKMQQKVNIKEQIVGWYSTGPSPVALDLAIHKLVHRLMSLPIDPVYLLVTVMETKEFPARAFIKQVTSRTPGEQPTETFDAIQTRMGQQIAEEIGIEHLLRDVKGVEISDLSTMREGRINGLTALSRNLEIVCEYLEKTPKPKSEIVNLLQEVLYDLPLLSTAVKEDLAQLTNENQLTVLMGLIGRSLTAIHDVILNRESQIRLERKLKEEFEEGEEKEETNESSNNSEEAPME